MRMDVRIHGARETEAALRRMANAASADRFVPALRAAAEDIVEAAQALVPVRTGRLRASIGIAPGEDQGRYHASLVVGHLNAYGQGISTLIEFGTRHVAARPYMRPAYKNVAERIPQTFGKAAWSVIQADAARFRARIT